ncbi:hypothetical protein N8539_00960 [Akkermansiaceae bacterium]|nr:hypothetical protein [Akkermansiaceae bacterium]MDB4272575.1 DUF445 domain-containing protein [bacterium]MDB4504317.1 hypothetical protein [Akkermansiaceae bacterium]MDB4547080.1 hypothetical protein [Akkermansiaceae bacterium]MDB4614943.1 hypothetical protein [Akkermansiaceae bacterium]
MKKQRPLLNKSLLTNLITILLAIGGYFWSGSLLSIGLFAFSGALTNWLAIHMLFEKVPGFYGSGVIPARFEDFKIGIHRLIMQQFFTEENITRFFEGNEDSGRSGMDLAPLIDSVDLDPSFEALKVAVMKSKLGGTLAMFGGAAALDPIKPDFVDEMRGAVKEIVSTEDFQKKLQAMIAGGSSSGEHSELLARVNVIVEKRLEELTPKMVKDIIQQMIREHLGWLVVWGGVCGGLIGLVASVLETH